MCFRTAKGLTSRHRHTGLTAGDVIHKEMKDLVVRPTKFARTPASLSRKLADFCMIPANSRNYARAVVRKELLQSYGNKATRLLTPLM